MGQAVDTGETPTGKPGEQTVSSPVVFIVSLLLGGVVGGAAVGQLKSSDAEQPVPQRVRRAPPAAREIKVFPEYPSSGPDPTPVGSRALYLDLMKRTLTDLIYEEDPSAIAARKDGRDWPGRGHTMIGLVRLDNLHSCMEDVLKRDIPGDFIECGAWRGGATIFMRAVLKAHGVTNRKVWVADSFAGLPPPDAEKYPADTGDKLHTLKGLAVSLEQVKSNFVRYGLLDRQVEFLKGWFKDTLPVAKIDRLALLRIDGDMYESTTDALRTLYPKLSVGGYVIIDDVGAVPACQKAVQDYRSANGITAELKEIDWTGVYWKKEK